MALEPCWWGRLLSPLDSFLKGSLQSWQKRLFGSLHISWSSCFTKEHNPDFTEVEETSKDQSEQAYAVDIRKFSMQTTRCNQCLTGQQVPMASRQQETWGGTHKGAAAKAWSFDYGTTAAGVTILLFSQVYCLTIVNRVGHLKLSWEFDQKSECSLMVASLWDLCSQER